MKRDQHADTFEDEECYVEICREVDLVEELDEERCMGDIETLLSNKRCTDSEARDHVCCSPRDEKPGIPGGSATTRQDGSRQGHARIPAKQMGARLGGVTRPVDLWHGTGGTLGGGGEGNVGNSDVNGDTCDGGWESSELDGGRKIGKWRDCGSNGSDEKRKPYEERQQREERETSLEFR